jgi:leucyl aminopeptidase
MSTIVKAVIDIPEKQTILFITRKGTELSHFGFTDSEREYLTKQIDANKNLITFNRYTHLHLVCPLSEEGNEPLILEKIRKIGFQVMQKLREEKIDRICLMDLCNEPELTLALTEGILLSSYQFNRYKTNPEKIELPLAELSVASPSITICRLTEVNTVVQSVFLARDLVNETPETLTAQSLSEQAKAAASQFGFSARILEKTDIEDLKMGGLLAVNKGSKEPPTFTILEWKPEQASNQNPVVLVGKGVVFDTGGINLKTMPGSLDGMKADMGGAAAVIGAFAAIAQNKLPLHVIGLIPATDNRPGFNAYVPGDVITMHNGTTVEVINTDAEGRLILADALSFARQFNPALTIDLATLTGSALMAIGPYGMVGMGTAETHVKEALSQSGETMCERIVWFPFWSEYDELIESKVADFKNMGGKEAGAITAGKFLSKFTDYPWLHLDIAGPAYHDQTLNYRGTGASGVGVRLLYHFLKRMCD